MGVCCCVAVMSFCFGKTDCVRIVLSCPSMLRINSISEQVLFMCLCLDDVKGIITCHLYNHLPCSYYAGGYWADEMTVWQCWRLFYWQRNYMLCRSAPYLPKGATVECHCVKPPVGGLELDVFMVIASIHQRFCCHRG